MLKYLSLLFICLFSAAATSQAERIYLGIDVLEQTGFRALQGKNVGLLTHPAGVNRNGESTIDVLRRANNVRLVTLFGPEHGIYGNEKANVPVKDKIDPRTNLPVFSLYGKYRKPEPIMLANIDVLVIDLQDVGVRSYTYVSCMRYAMEACFASNKEVIVLDRPNPLGGLKVDGPPLDKQWRSYVGAFHVPYVHGLTIGELARIAKHTPGWMEVPDSVRKKGKLTVIPMRGWRRDMLWPETGLRWVPTSPYIPDLSAVLGYAMTGLGAQEGGFSHGIGTPYPFRLLRFKGKSPEQVLQALKAKNIPGLSYKTMKTQSAAGAPVTGVYIGVKDWSRVRPTEISFHMMQIAAAWSSSNPFHSVKNPALFNKHVGSTAWWNELQQRGAQSRVDAFVNQWSGQASQFQASAKRFWLY
ncbi:MAG: DUF1343 domain-containing protein [Opitutaceae bacterium]